MNYRKTRIIQSRYPRLENGTGRLSHTCLKRRSMWRSEVHGSQSRKVTPVVQFDHIHISQQPTMKIGSALH